MIISLASIRLDGGTQMRAELRQDRIIDYAEHLKDGATFPPVVVFDDGESQWLADGFHRHAAFKLAEMEELPAIVHAGTKLDAIRLALKANATNGEPRTGGDMRRAYVAAVNNGLCQPDDAKGIKEMLACSDRWARTLTKDARGVAKSERDARIVELAGQGLSQREIAGEVGVTQPLVSGILDDKKRNCSEIYQTEPSEPDAGDDYEDEFPRPTYDGKSKAWCKYCYTGHYDWQFEGEAWICGRCEHSTADEFMQAEDEREEESNEEQTSKNVHVSNNSGNNEWYTPPRIIDRARAVLGNFDLDPASSEKANEIVMAERFYTVDDDGLAKDWVGKVWMNPPYSANLVNLFTEKLRLELKAGRVSEAIVLVNNATETSWFQELASLAAAICFPRGRIKYLNSNGEPANTPLQGQSLLYFGGNTSSFEIEFCDIGFIL